MEQLLSDHLHIFLPGVWEVVSTIKGQGRLVGPLYLLWHQGSYPKDL